MPVTVIWFVTEPDTGKADGHGIVESGRKGFYRQSRNARLHIAATEIEETVNACPGLHRQFAAISLILMDKVAGFGTHGCHMQITIRNRQVSRRTGFRVTVGEQSRIIAAKRDGEAFTDGTADGE